MKAACQLLSTSKHLFFNDQGQGVTQECVSLICKDICVCYACSQGSVFAREVGHSRCSIIYLLGRVVVCCSWDARIVTTKTCTHTRHFCKANQVLYEPAVTHTHTQNTTQNTVITVSASNYCVCVYVCVFL